MELFLTQEILKNIKGVTKDFFSQISMLALNDNYLAVSSDRPTIHIFTLINENNNNKGNNEVKNTKSMFNGISKILRVGKILQSEWSFAQVKVPSNSKSIVSLFSDQNKIVIVNNQGKYISAVYNTKSESNAECKITKNIFC